MAAPKLTDAQLDAFAKGMKKTKAEVETDYQEFLV